MNEYLPWPCIRSDVEWVLNTPSLLAPSPHLWQPPKLDDIDFSMIWQQLDNLVKYRSSKLGHYFEALATAIVLADPRYQLLGNALIIEHEHKTIGEVDLLMRDQKTEDIIHLELALKFYLGVPGDGDPVTRFIGAGLHDFLHQKLNRLYHHQMVLPNLAKQLNAWPEQLPYPDKHLLWIPGRLYIPEGLHLDEMSYEVSGTPWHLNPHCTHSIWTTENDSRYNTAQPLQKADWLAGRSIHESELELPAQFLMSGQQEPVYVVPTDWQTLALEKIEEYQQSL